MTVKVARKHILFFVHNTSYMCRLWTLERGDTVLNMLPTVKENPSTDLEILLFVSDEFDFFYTM